MTTLPRICHSEPRTYRGAMRQYRALLAAYKRAFAGGGMFGWDWPTLHANSPEAYDKARALVAFMNTCQQSSNDYREIPT